MLTYIQMELIPLLSHHFSLTNWPSQHVTALTIN